MRMSKVRTNIMLDEDLKRRARSAGINLSEVAGEAIADAVRRAEIARIAEIARAARASPHEWRHEDTIGAVDESWDA
jgi:post-segregation antitoxin (ccd killing protein)